MKSLRKRLFITSGLLLILLAAVAVCFGYGLRYRYFHFYVHKGLIFFLDEEFKDLFNRYAKNRNFASTKGVDGLGIIVTYLDSENDGLSIQFRLVKNLKDDEFSFNAEIASPERSSHYNVGNPHIFMKIPMESFENVVQNGLTERQINRLIDTARKSEWKPFERKESLEIRPKPSVIVDFRS